MKAALLRCWLDCLWPLFSSNSSMDVIDSINYLPPALTIFVRSYKLSMWPKRKREGDLQRAQTTPFPALFLWRHPNETYPASTLIGDTFWPIEEYEMDEKGLVLGAFHGKLETEDNDNEIHWPVILPGLLIPCLEQIWKVPSKKADISSNVKLSYPIG